jgi:hypothetical protein
VKILEMHKNSEICSIMRYTKTTLQKLEALLEDIGYSIRYEKGSFNSGYCIVEQKKIAVINKFFDTEGRINSLNEVLSNIQFDESILTEPSAKFLERWRKRSADAEEEEES